MNYLVTGGLGFIGTNLSIKLNELSIGFTLLDKLQGEDVVDCPVVPLAYDKIVHLAAFTNIRESIKWPRQAIKQNCDSTLQALTWARDLRSHLIFSSSMGAASPTSPYTASKLACEAFCTAFRESFGIDTTILRFSNVYGPHSKFKGSVIPTFIKRALHKKSLEIYGNGFQTRDFVYVDDVTDAIVNCPKRAFMNIASGTTTSVLEIAEHIQRLSEIRTNFCPKIELYKPIKGEITKVSTTTDIKPKTSLEEGLEKTFNWFLDHYAA